MMDTFFLIKAFVLKDSFIPFWELQTKNFEEEGEEPEYKLLHPENNYRRILDSEMRDVYYDVHTKTIHPGELLNSYKELEYEVGETIFVEVENRRLLETKITGVEWELYFNTTYWGKDLKVYHKGEWPDLQVEDDKLYHIKTWSPRYLTEDLNETIWEYRIFKKK